MDTRKCPNAALNLTDRQTEKPKSFYRTVKIKEPLMIDKADLIQLELDATILYDSQTKVNKAYRFTARD